MEKSKTSKLSYLGYAWTTIVNIFTVFVALAIFNSTYSNFETIVLSITVLIYISLTSFTSGFSLVKQIEIMAIGEEFKKVRVLLKEKVDEYDEEYEKEQIENGKNNLKKQQVKFYINAGFAFIIYIIALLNLFGSI